MGLSHLQFGYRGEILRILPTVPDDTRAELPWSRGERFLLTLGFMLGLLRSEPQLEKIWSFTDISTFAPSVCPEFVRPKSHLSVKKEFGWPTLNGY